jgi:photosystem II stability/assembly factor-like uncharacterized protein
MFVRAVLAAGVLLSTAVPFSHAQTVDPSLLKVGSWRFVGPTRGGRVEAVAGISSQPLVYYMGSTGGGVWKTVDGGIAWHNVSDGYFKTGSVGALQIAPSDPNTIYVGMGESCLRGDASYGDGVYKSTDAGKTWKNVGLEKTRHIARIRINPTDPNDVYVAAFGDEFGPSEDRGVFHSTNGGASWEKILFRDAGTGAIDLTMQADNPKVLYASFLELRRFPWGLRSGGDNTSLYKTVDGGKHWEELTNKPGMPSGPKGRIGIAQSPVMPNRVWALVDASIGKKGLFRSDDAGETWQRMTDNADLTQRPWYYHHIFADPKNADRMWVLNIDMWESMDGGKTFKQVSPPHGDNHDLWVDPNNTSRWIQADDGGATITTDGGKTWSSEMNQATSQMYHVTTDQRYPYRLYASQQDNNTISVPSQNDDDSITAEDYYSVGDGESGYVAVNPANNNVVYGGNHHWTYRSDHVSKILEDISPNPETHYGWGAADINYRFQWTFPVVTSALEPNAVYVTSQYVHKSTDEGRTWQIISPDLTRHNPKYLEMTPHYKYEPKNDPFWGPITRDNTGIEWYSVIFAFAESPVQKGLLWAGTDDGYVQVSKDGGAHWDKVTPPMLPEYALISIIDPSAQDPGTAYVAANKFKFQDHHPYLYVTHDYGKTWKQITDGIPADDFTRTIRSDPAHKGLLYAGTETSVYVSFDDGAHWQSLGLNLPHVPVHDLVVQHSKDGLEYDLVAATHGRGFWILDHLDQLGQVKTGLERDPVVVFEPSVAVRSKISTPKVFSATYQQGVFGTNPPRGLVVNYYLKEKASTPITLTIKDAKGEVVRTWTSGVAAPAATRRRAKQSTLTTEAGLNHFTWDLGYTAATILPGTILANAAPQPFALPGTYSVTLEVAGKSYTKPFTVVKDPRNPSTDEQLAKQFAFMANVRDTVNELEKTVAKIRAARAEATKWAGTSADRAAKLEAFNDKLYPIEEQLTQYRAHAGQDLSNYPTALDGKMCAVAGLASEADVEPTAAAYDRFGQQVALLKKLEGETDAAIAGLPK